MRSSSVHSTKSIQLALTNQQSAKMVVMVSPDTFQFNSQTADTNSFQHETEALDSPVTQQALSEFAAMVKLLRSHNIEVLVLPSRTDLPTPDAVFPNNWFSTHITPDGREILTLFPMMAPNRRAERQFSELYGLLKSHHITIDETIDLTPLEDKQCFLEGTGSLILDHIHHIAYAAISPRTNLSAVKLFCDKTGYQPITFHSFDDNGKAIYHTNVLMSVGSQFAVLAVDTIPDADEKEMVLASLAKTNKKLIAITNAQMARMAGNILEVRSTDGKSYIVMSQTAFDAFTPEQRELILTFGEPIKVKIDTIEKLGGGSARCMLAEIFYPDEKNPALISATEETTTERRPGF